MGTHGSDTLLEILNEKDKLIVSLKEASTKRDKLNENQISVLSHANHKLQQDLQKVSDKFNQIQEKLYKSESELGIYKATNESISEKLESIKNEFTSYKDSISEHLNNLKSTIDIEWTKRETQYQESYKKFQTIIDSLNEKVNEIENYYQDILHTIADKQGSAKVIIRDAIDKLNDALNFLDLGDSSNFKPRHLHDKISDSISTAKESISTEAENIKQQNSGDTIVKNIENVNIKLTSDSKLSSLFSEVQNLSVKNTTDQISRTMSNKSADSTNNSSKISEGDSGIEPSTGSAQNSQADFPQKTHPDSAPENNPSPNNPNQNSNSLNSQKNEISEDNAYIKKQSQETVNRTILDKDNFAPFNWDKFLSDLQLKKFENFIRSANKAIKSGDYMKAIDLFKTIRDQPSIQDSNVAVKMIDDEIEYLEKHIKNKYSQTSL